MRYLLVDRILEWAPGESIRGIKNVAMSEDFLEFHFPGNPIMPGALLVEALVQLSGWLEAASSDFRNWILLHTVHRCMFYGFAFPGDTVELGVRTQGGGDGARRTFVGTCTVADKKKVVAEFEGETIPLGDIEHREDQRKLFTLLTRSRTEI